MQQRLRRLFFNSLGYAFLLAVHFEMKNDSGRFDQLVGLLVYLGPILILIDFLRSSDSTK